MEPPSGDLSNGTNSLLEAAFCEPKLCSGNQPQPQCVFAQESNACLVLTWHYATHRAKVVLGASGSVIRATWRVVSADLYPTQPCYTAGIRLM